MSFLERLRHPFQPRQFVRRNVVEPFQEFMALEAASGIVIVAAAFIALIWANSPWDEQYFELWNEHVHLDFNLFTINESLGHLVNDGLMAIFFFVVGLEIKREVVHGQLSTPKSASLPVIAALGGMAVPGLIYLMFNPGGDAAKGWAIPVATDIAFAVGVLSLVGNRVPLSLKIFLLALAIADDLGGIFVIAAFYTDEISLEALMYAGIILLIINGFRLYGVRTLNVYVFFGALMWVAVLKSGIHATIAGVVLALFTPASSYYDPNRFRVTARGLLGDPDTDDHDARQSLFEEMEDLSRGSEAPLDRLEHMLAPWVSFLIVPIFALANAGVVITGESVSDAVGAGVSWGIVLGLVIGKPVGIFTFTYLAVRLGLANRPHGVTWLQVFGVGLLGGVGFTVALFITELAFESQVLINDAKMGILAGSIVAAVIGYLFLRLTPAHPDA
ncbi:MAG: Na+/H+ antiporter NhaA [Dehalococcoidia bacterium]|nr:Na+/H+ antiporter NhaA [Dehalococcoidia bacterium]MCA9825408.1 Na+/H+ antiporter NhaA [Dehalococcoidia bacterium]